MADSSLEPEAVCFILCESCPGPVNFAELVCRRSDRLRKRVKSALAHKLAGHNNEIVSVIVLVSNGDKLFPFIQNQVIL